MNVHMRLRGAAQPGGPGCHVHDSVAVTSSDPQYGQVVSATPVAVNFSQSFAHAPHL